MAKKTKKASRKGANKKKASGRAKAARTAGHLEAGPRPGGIFVERPQEYQGHQAASGKGPLKVLAAVVVVAVVAALLWRADRGEAVDPMAETPGAESALPQARRPLPPQEHAHEKGNRDHVPANRWETMDTKPATRGRAGQERMAISPHATAIPDPPREQAFDKNVAVPVQAGPDGATLRVFRDKPRELVFQAKAAPNSGKSTLEWNGTGLDGRPVSAGLYYISVTDAQGVTNDELWVR